MTNKILAIIAASLIGGMTSAYAQNTGLGTRVDYLDANGNRIISKDVEVGSGGGYLFYVGGTEKFLDIEAGYGLGPAVKSMKFIPYGTESYPLTVENNETGDVSMTYEIIGNGGTTRSAAKTDDKDILCGTEIKFTIKVPSGTYPVLWFKYHYTQTSPGEEEPRWLNLSANTLAQLQYETYMNVGYHRSQSEKEWKLNYIGSVPEVFERDAKNPDIWYYTMWMPNEPLTIMADSEIPDGQMLRTSVQRALTGLYTQYQGLNGNSVNGEGAIQREYGDGLSQDYVSYYKKLCNFNFGLEILSSPNGWISHNMWYICYALIDHSNLLLKYIDQFTGASQQERDNARAQMLALRSHAYWRLLQTYGYRWCDSDNGAKLCVPLETEYGVENPPVATMRQIVNQCYSDLDEAIRILGDANYKREDVREIDVNVARGIKMRLALLSEDWVTVDQLATSILDVKPLTTNAELTSGFFKACDSWIWGASNYQKIGDAYDNGLYYWAEPHITGCNGAYPTVWSMGAGAIDKKLYQSMSETDVRRKLFAMPDQLIKTTGYSTWEAWHNGNNLDDNLFLFNPKRVIMQYSRNIPEGVTDGAFTHEGKDGKVPYGAQVKFYMPGSGYDAEAVLVLMRSEEVLLSQAEAACRLGDDAKAKALLNKLNSMRDPEGALTAASGDALLAEIQKTRKIELWGEGHSWFDQKRWNMPLTRTVWRAGDVESGNWFRSVPETVATDAADGWRLYIPKNALSDNSAIDITKMGYSAPENYETQQRIAPAQSAPAQRPAAAVKVAQPICTQSPMLRMEK